MRLICISRLASLALSAFLLGPTAWAQDYPTKLIRLVVPFAPGAGTEMAARTIAHNLTEAWGQPVVVDMRPGGTGAVGSSLVARSPADGYTLLIGTSSTHAVSPSFNSKLPFDPVKDFAAVSLVLTGPEMMTVHPSVPVKSVKDLVVLAKARPRTLNYGSTGAGSLGHMTMELFKKVGRANNIVHVPYKGAGAAVTDLLSGYVQLMFTGPPAVISHVRTRKLNALAMASPKRVEWLKDIPTFAEAGYPGVEAEQWYGLFAPADTPESVVDKLSREIVRITQLPDVKVRFLTSGFDAASSTPQQFAQRIKDDLAKWKKVVKGLEHAR